MIPEAAAADDGRIPVRFGRSSDGGPDTALLIEGAAIAAGQSRAVAGFVLEPGRHPLSCACCRPRGPVADALGRLFLARARGDVPFFASVIAVVVTEAGATALRDALSADVVTRARYRLLDGAAG